MPPERWNDDRLDDFYEAFRRVSERTEEVGILRTTLERVGEDIKSVRSNVHDLREDITTQSVQWRNDMAAVAENQRKERKVDRRWFIGTVLSSAGLVITAVGLLVNKL